MSLWNGADAHCNIHIAGVHHCPWCAYGTAASLIPYLGIVAVQAAIVWWPRPVRLRLLLALAAFPVTGAAIAGIYAWITGYY